MSHGVAVVHIHALAHITHSQPQQQPGKAPLQRAALWSTVAMLAALGGCPRLIAWAGQGPLLPLSSFVGL